MSHRNTYMTDELEAIFEQTREFVAKEVEPVALQGSEGSRDGLGIAEITGQAAVSRPGQPVPNALQGLCASGEEHHVVAGLGEDLGHGPPDARGGSRH